MVAEGGILILTSTELSNADLHLSYPIVVLPFSPSLLVFLRESKQFYFHRQPLSKFQVSTTMNQYHIVRQMCISFPLVAIDIDFRRALIEEQKKGLLSWKRNTNEYNVKNYGNAVVSSSLTHENQFRGVGIGNARRDAANHLSLCVHLFSNFTSLPCCASPGAFLFSAPKNYSN